jgi:hypothetical protein
VLACALGAPALADFASTVIDYAPAPGQFINGQLTGEGLALNDPAAALGPPTGGSLASADNTGVVTLGGFGGSITLGFAQTVLDDPLNPMGLDAIVFGNAFYVAGNPARRWAEAGVIEIALDANNNGLADDPWYVLPGSDLPGPPPLARTTQTWDADPATPLPPAEPSWYPDPALYPGVGFTIDTAAYALPAPFTNLVLETPPGTPAGAERYHGYADLSPTLPLGDTNADGIVEDPAADPSVFFTRPDSPLTLGIDAGSAGGDAFDIAWAIDPHTGLPARLPGFDFIRISTAVNAVNPLFGERSVEIDATADVRPDANAFDIDASGTVNAEDLYRWHELRAQADPAAELSGDQTIDDRDRDLLARAARRDEATTTEVRP